MSLAKEWLSWLLVKECEDCADAGGLKVREVDGRQLLFVLSDDSVKSRRRQGRLVDVGMDSWPLWGSDGQLLEVAGPSCHRRGLRGSSQPC